VRCQRRRGRRRRRAHFGGKTTLGCGNDTNGGFGSHKLGARGREGAKEAPFGRVCAGAGALRSLVPLGGVFSRRSIQGAGRHEIDPAKAPCLAVTF